jgi:putative ABC transport system ATP-binding protein
MTSTELEKTDQVTPTVQDPPISQTTFTRELDSPSVDENAAYAYQEEMIGQDDPMMQAIEQQMGEQLSPTNSLEPPISENAFTENEIFRCTNLTKAYGRGAAYIEVIKGISFSVNRGEYIVIYGPSGAGKSTLIHLLAGLEVPNRGEIRMHNQIIQRFSDEELAYYHREVIGLVFQKFNLLESLRVWENVAFPLMLAGAPLEWRQHESLKMLSHFGLGDYANHYPSQLSGGQQQRVSLVRALIHDPDILLIDEPTGNLDSVSANMVIEEIDRLHKQEERTIILVTHSEVFLPYATRVFYIKDGTLLTSNEQNSTHSIQ